MPKKLLLPLLVSLSAISAEVPADDRPSKPNIVLLMADDMGVGDTSAYLGHKISPGLAPIERTLNTPRLEQFAQNALVFTQAHAPASMCSSTRYSLLTGRFAHRASLKHQGWLPHGPNRPMIARELTTLPEMLQRAGYHTGGVGKYHVGVDYDNGSGKPATDFYFHDADLSKPFLDGPCDHGFDEYFGVPGNTEDPLDTEPRVYMRNQGLEPVDPAKLVRIGMERKKGKIIADPSWDLLEIGARFLEEIDGFLERSAEEKEPFFLYITPCANHNQRNPDGVFAVPEQLAGFPIKGESRYTDDTPAGPREDMVLENDILFGEVLDQLAKTDDPRWPGHKLIENTLVIFTSDNGPNIGNEFNDVPNQESGGLRGKKAKIWQGGLQVPFLASWPGVLEGGGTYDGVFSLTDLFATLASLVDQPLTTGEAVDSHACFDHWLGKETEDLRPRILFCHLGSPLGNDAVALRIGSWKLIADGGLADAYQINGSRGAVDAFAHVDLLADPLETSIGSRAPSSDLLQTHADLLVAIHNRGYARTDISRAEGDALILDDGWNNPRNDLDGEVGFEFRVTETREVSHLGLWDAIDKKLTRRPPRAVPTEGAGDRPDKSGSKGRTLAAEHRIVLREIGAGGVVAEGTLGPGSSGELAGEFRFVPLASPVQLEPRKRYRLTMSTAVGDGDPFRDPASWDGLPPVIATGVVVERAVFMRSGEASVSQLPAPIDMTPDYYRHRVPVGPTLRFAP